jgi:hypothetical protein
MTPEKVEELVRQYVREAQERGLVLIHDQFFTPSGNDCCGLGACMLAKYNWNFEDVKVALYEFVEEDEALAAEDMDFDDLMIFCAGLAAQTFGLSVYEINAFTNGFDGSKIPSSTPESKPFYEAGARLRHDFFPEDRPGTIDESQQGQAES